MSTTAATVPNQKQGFRRSAVRLSAQSSVPLHALKDASSALCRAAQLCKEAATPHIQHTTTAAAGV